MTEVLKVLSFEEWLDEVETELNCILSETGADREMDFDFEKDAEKMYEKYIETGMILPNK